MPEGTQHTPSTPETAEPTPEFVTPLRMALNNLHEIYVGLCASGFTRTEAARICAHVLTTGNGEPQS